MQFLWFKTLSKKSITLVSTLILLGYKHTQTRHDYSFYILSLDTNIYSHVLRIHKYKAKYYLYNHTTGMRTYKNIDKNTVNYLFKLL